MVAGRVSHRSLSALRVLVAGTLVAVPSPALAEEAAEGRPDAPRTIALRATDGRITSGDSITLIGRAAPSVGGASVTVEHRGADGGNYRELGQVRTDRQGHFRFSTTPEASGSFRATWGRAAESDTVQVAVGSRLTAGARKHQLRSRGLRVSGHLEPSRADRRIALQRLTGKGWTTVASDRTDREGRYRVRWGSPPLGGHTVRAVYQGDGDLDGDRARIDHPIYVYRSDLASYYGPRFYGNKTACGQVLRRETVGVAHKSLPCGTNVRFHYKGRTRRIEVIDRGPFIRGRRWDLTNAARRKLGFPRGVDEIWATR